MNLPLFFLLEASALLAAAQEIGALHRQAQGVKHLGFRACGAAYVYGFQHYLLLTKGKGGSASLYPC